MCIIDEMILNTDQYRGRDCWLISARQDEPRRKAKSRKSFCNLHEYGFFFFILKGRNFEEKIKYFLVILYNILGHNGTALVVYAREFNFV